MDKTDRIIFICITITALFLSIKAIYWCYEEEIRLDDLEKRVEVLEKKVEAYAAF